MNNNVVAINPDHIAWVDVLPDTTIRLYNGEKLLVRESLDELIEAYVSLRRQIHSLGEGVCPLGRFENGPPFLPLPQDEEED